MTKKEAAMVYLMLYCEMYDGRMESQLTEYFGDDWSRTGLQAIREEFDEDTLRNKLRSEFPLPYGFDADALLAHFAGAVVDAESGATLNKVGDDIILSEEGTAIAKFPVASVKELLG